MTTTDCTWDEILNLTEAFGREANSATYIKIDPNDSKYENYRHCSHVMVYAKSSEKSFNLYDRRAIVLMQMRFDGYLGFPGGLVDMGETPLQAANRELTEEMGWKSSYGVVRHKHHQFTHLCPERHLVLHFYAIEIKETIVHDIEVACLNTLDHGEEVMGMMRVPLYTFPDGYLGFPSFLHNNFLGCSRIQLLTTLLKYKILSKMQMRFDGYLGFGGGLVEPGETASQGAYRELQEEIGWKEEFGVIGPEHHQFTHLNASANLVLHFFAIEVKEEMIPVIEANALKAADYGEEMLGLIRVPLYTMGDAFRGFPCFLQNKFAGNAKAQLLETLVNFNIMTQEHIIRSLSAGPLVIT